MQELHHGEVRLIYARLSRQDRRRRKGPWQMAEAHSEARRIGEAIRQARVLQRRSQKDVAAALGYHQSKVSRLESGRGTEDIRVLRVVAQELKIRPEQLGLAAASDVSTADPEAEEMHRRTFLAASIVALATPATAAAAHDELVQSLLPGLNPASTRVPLDTAVLRERVGAARRLFYL
jgi:transcriptional regulator with XRE-family HTH domain